MPILLGVRLSCLLTFIPYWTLATSGLLDMKVKSLRFMVKGMGMMRLTNSAISNTRRAKTY